jgi:predicted O-methyltransferase YrrM
METLSTGRVADTLARLFAEAELADRPLMERFAEVEIDDAFFAQQIALEQNDLRGVYQGYAENFLNVAPEYGRFLYQCARGRRATRIVEFGTSMGVSAIYLAAALRDMGGGRLVGSEIEPAKAERARANLASAGLAEFVDIRVGDARETLLDVGGPIDMVLLDGAFSLYLPILKLLEPHLTSGAVILAENAFDHGNDYLDYVRDPTHGYLSQPIPVSEGRGNEYSVFVR